MSKRERNHISRPRANPDVCKSRRYSRFVGLMKFLLPLVAVALVGLIIAWPRLDSGDTGFRFSFADLERDADGTPGVSRARFAGADAQSRPFLITAERAVQMQGFDVFVLTGLQADIAAGDGTWLSITAGAGTFHRGDRVLMLEGAIDIFTNLGYELHATDATLDMDDGVMRSKLPIEGHGPLGSLRADTLRYSTADKSLHLAGAVRVVLNPSRDG